MRTLLALPVIRLALDGPRWTPKKEIIIKKKSQWHWRELNPSLLHGSLDHGGQLEFVARGAYSNTEISICTGGLIRATDLRCTLVADFLLNKIRNISKTIYLYVVSNMFPNLPGQNEL